MILGRAQICPTLPKSSPLLSKNPVILLQWKVSEEQKSSHFFHILSSLLFMADCFFYCLSFRRRTSRSLGLFSCKQFNMKKETNTMDFEEFRENLMEDLRDQIYQRTGNECTVEATNVAKLQNAGYEGIVIRPEESPVGINLDAQSLYNDYENGKNYEDVLEGAVRMTTEGFAHQPEFNIDDFSNYDVMKEKLSMQIVPTERNAEMLEKIPHKEIEDMSVVCRFVVGNDETRKPMQSASSEELFCMTLKSSMNTLIHLRRKAGDG